MELLTPTQPAPSKITRTRLFTAFPVPQRVQFKYIWLEGKAPELEELPLRNLHVNVRFIGEVIPELVPVVKTALAAVSACGPFAISLKGLYIHPAKGVYLLCSRVEDAAPLTAVKDAVDQALDGIEGVPPALKRLYRPSMLVARFKNKPSKELVQLVTKNKAKLFGAFSVDALTLYKSRLDPGGAEHSPVAKYRFEGPPFPIRQELARGPGVPARKPRAGAPGKAYPAGDGQGDDFEPARIIRPAPAGRVVGQHRASQAAPAAGRPGGRPGSAISPRADQRVWPKPGPKAGPKPVAEPEPPAPYEAVRETAPATVPQAPPGSGRSEVSVTASRDMTGPDRAAALGTDCGTVSGNAPDDTHGAGHEAASGDNPLASSAPALPSAHGSRLGGEPGSPPLRAADPGSAQVNEAAGDGLIRETPGEAATDAGTGPGIPAPPEEPRTPAKPAPKRPAKFGKKRRHAAGGGRRH
ncbi:MAG: hypothetical protein LBG06_13045 [Deltaproteobacteria bacterium]|jgi:2'-5' RNA ligase|nr:hypothetical protein [Deltaproteobacteria bacterium]